MVGGMVTRFVTFKDHTLKQRVLHRTRDLNRTLCGKRIPDTARTYRAQEAADVTCQSCDAKIEEMAA